MTHSERLLRSLPMGIAGMGVAARAGVVEGTASAENLTTYVLIVQPGARRPHQTGASAIPCSLSDFGFRSSFPRTGRPEEYRPPTATASSSPLPAGGVVSGLRDRVDVCGGLDRPAKSVEHTNGGGQPASAEGGRTPMPQPTTQRRHPGWLTRLRRGLDWGAIFVLLSVLFLGMQLCADLIGVAAGATQFGQPWNVDLSGDNASGSGLGGGMIYTCAPGAPSRGAVFAVFRGVSIRDGQYAGTIGNTETRLECVTFAGTTVACGVAVPRDVAPIRDELTRGDSITARVGPARDPLGVAVVGLRGSARAIAHVRRECR